MLFAVTMKHTLFSAIRNFMSFYRARLPKWKGIEDVMEYLGSWALKLHMNFIMTENHVATKSVFFSHYFLYV